MTPNRDNMSARPALRTLNIALLCALVLLAVSPVGAAKRNPRKHRGREDREKYITIEAYKEMTVFERAAYDKALKLHRSDHVWVAPEAEFLRERRIVSLVSRSELILMNLNLLKP